MVLPHLKRHAGAGEAAGAPPPPPPVPARSPCHAPLPPQVPSKRQPPQVGTRGPSPHWSSCAHTHPEVQPDPSFPVLVLCPGPAPHPSHEICAFLPGLPLLQQCHHLPAGLLVPRGDVLMPWALAQSLCVLLCEIGTIIAPCHQVVVRPGGMRQSLSVPATHP